MNDVRYMTMTPMARYDKLEEALARINDEKLRALAKDKYNLMSSVVVNLGNDNVFFFQDCGRFIAMYLGNEQYVFDTWEEANEFAVKEQAHINGWPVIVIPMCEDNFILH